MAAALPGLVRLGNMRERRALAVLAEAERTLGVARDACDRQRARLETLEHELAEVVARAVDGPTPTVESFRQLDARRDWFHENMRTERHHLNEREQALAALEHDAAIARRDWFRARERGAALSRRGASLARDASRRAENRADLDRAAVVADAFDDGCRGPASIGSTRS